MFLSLRWNTTQRNWRRQPFPLSDKHIKRIKLISLDIYISRDRENGPSSGILTVRNFFKGPHPSSWGQQGNPVSSQLLGFHWKLSGLHPDPGIICVLNIHFWDCSGRCHLSFSGKWRETRILNDFSFISFATSQVIAFQCLVWFVFESCGEWMGD